MVFWDFTSHRFVRGCQCLEGICILHLQGRKYLQAEVFTEIFVPRYPTAQCHTPKYSKFCTLRYDNLKYNERQGVQFSYNLLNVTVSLIHYALEMQSCSPGETNYSTQCLLRLCRVVHRSLSLSKAIIVSEGELSLQSSLEKDTRK